MRYDPLTIYSDAVATHIVTHVADHLSKASMAVLKTGMTAAPNCAGGPCDRRAGEPDFDRLKPTFYARHARVG